MSVNRNLIFAASVVAVGFFWVSSAFFSYLEVLKANFSPEAAHLLIIGLSYGAQILGILLYVFIVARNRKLAESKLVMSVALALSVIGILGAFLSTNNVIIIVSGILFSAFGTSGVMLGFQFSCITEKLPQMYYGRAFSFAYAAGALGTPILAFLCGGRCPVGFSAAAIYIAFIVLNLVLILNKGRLTTDISDTAAPDRGENIVSPRGGVVVSPRGGAVAGNLIIMFAGIIILMGVLDSMSGLMQHAYLEAVDQVNTMNARIFYAIGLIPAGLLMDYSRRMGAVACLVTRVFSFLLILLFLTPMRGFEAVALNYLLNGFFIVYRTATAMDIAKKASLLYFPVFGILFGRVGEFIVFTFYSKFQMDILAETVTASVLFMILLLIFLPFMKKMYDPILPESVSSAQEQTLGDMIASYGITAREAETLRLLMSGKSTRQIAEAMFITEKTVQNYVNSLLSKTGANSRIKLVSLFRK